MDEREKELRSYLAEQEAQREVGRERQAVVHAMQNGQPEQIGVIFDRKEEQMENPMQPGRVSPDITAAQKRAEPPLEREFTSAERELETLGDTINELGRAIGTLDTRLGPVLAHGPVSTHPSDPHLTGHPPGLREAEGASEIARRVSSISSMVALRTGELLALTAMVRQMTDSLEV